MAVIDELIAILGYRVQGQENLKKFAHGLDDAEKKARSSARAMNRLGGAVSGFLTGAVSVGGLKAAVTQFAQLERTVTRIGLTANASAAETRKVGDALFDMAKQYALPLEQVTSGLDTLVASGKSLDEALAFLPSVLATAQASGSATEHIANTTLKVSEALKISATQSQRVLDLALELGKSGQFELKEMAQYIPELANSFASLGYKGTEGFKTLLALMQTVREDTGSASTAASQLKNVFGKIYSEETAKNFADFGIDLDRALAKARAAGEGTVEAFIRISKEALKGDLSKLPKLFTDQEFREGMQSLITSPEALKRFLDVANSAKVDGSVFRDLGVVLEGTQAKIQNLETSWTRFMNAVGGAAAGPLGSVMDAASDQLSFGNAVQEGLKREGVTDQLERNKRVIQLTLDPEERDRLARLGGYVPQAGLHPLGDSRLSPLQVERRKLEAEREALEARRARVDSLRVLRGTPGAEHRARELTRFGLDIGDVNAKINRTYPVDPDRHKRFIGSQPAPPMPPSRPDAAASVINDHSQDNRQYPVTNNVTITMNVQQATEAPAAAASATAGAVKAGLQMQPARMHFEGR